jgi:hypothetical protein
MKLHSTRGTFLDPTSVDQSENPRQSLAGVYGGDVSGEAGLVIVKI